MTIASNTTASHAGRQRGIGDLRAFLGSVLRRPTNVGAMAPTGSQVTAQAASVVPRIGQPLVAELGAGAGAISDAIGVRLGGQPHMAIELDASLAAHLRRTRPRLEVVQADAATINAQLRARGRPALDAVVSSLPWTLLDAGQQRQLLHEIARALHADGAFTAIGYLSAPPGKARAFRARLAERFDEVTVSSTIWRNIPPAKVYVCRRPRVDAGDPASVPESAQAGSS